jgi:hypothetical protein
MKNATAASANKSGIPRPNPTPRPTFAASLSPDEEVPVIPAVGNVVRIAAIVADAVPVAVFSSAVPDALDAPVTPWSSWPWPREQQLVF